MLPIYIPSRGRFREDDIMHGPLPLLPAAQLAHTTVVVPVQEAGSYRLTLERKFHGSGLRMYSMDYHGIAEKRERIGRIARENRQPYFMMLDDDINFLRRASADSASQVTVTDQSDIEAMLASVEEHLQAYNQVALGMREVNKTAMLGPSPLREDCSRAIRAVAWVTSTFCSLEHRRVQVMEDHDLTLQLLESGRPNAVLWYWMSGQRGTNTHGGCSSWRTLEVHNDAATTLHRLHPQVTRLRVKENKSGGAISTRLEVTIYWKKAMKIGVEADEQHT